MPAGTDPFAFLSVLHLADSALPIGRAVHSNGMEAWLEANPTADEIAIAELIKTSIIENVAPLDGVLLAHAHEALTLPHLIELDHLATASKASAPARIASESMGRRLIRVAPLLGAETQLLSEYLAAAEDGRAVGNVAIVEGVLARSMGIEKFDTILVVLRSAACDLANAAVRLGRLSASSSQVVIVGMSPAIVAAARDTVRAPLDALRSNGGELEIASFVHNRLSARSFAT